MKKYFAFSSALLILLVSLGAANAKPRKSTLLDILSKRETKLWEGWKNHQAAPFQSALSPDTVLVGESGLMGKADAVTAMSSTDCTVQDYTLSDFKVSMISKDVALLTYKANQHGTCAGVTLPANVVASSIWVKRGGKWYAAFHQETPAAGQTS